jgi:hypothetical protein
VFQTNLLTNPIPLLTSTGALGIPMLRTNLGRPPDRQTAKDAEISGAARTNG